MAKDEELPRHLKPPAGKVLNRWGRTFWKANAGDLNQAGLLEETDVASFIMLCQAYGLAMESAVKIAEEGLFRQDENNITRKHPATQVHRDAVTMFNRLADKFALNPKARQAMKVETGDADPFVEYLRRRPGRQNGGLTGLLEMPEEEYQGVKKRAKGG